MYEITDFNNVILFVWNRGIEEFTKMYKTIGCTGTGYIEEKFQQARDSFATWWLNLDNEVQKKIIEYVKNFYAKNNK